MCGITGLFNFQNQPVPNWLLKRMNDLMIHRGPDAEGFYESHPIHIAMRRLKVIDLETGNQPISDESRNYWIVFNGEIYNYRELRDDLIKKGHCFSTHSDTEVILKLYIEKGDACVHDLIGMFAFAIYHKKDSSLFLARDRMGIKPLFYHFSENGFVFGSEIKPILQTPWLESSMDLQSLSHYLSLNYLPPPFTPFKNIFQLEPGHWIKVTKNKHEIHRYWDIPMEPPIDVSENEAIRTIEQLLHKSIERRLIADVPVGAFLSGGLDSSLIVAFMKEHKHDKIKTFSVGFEDPNYDETPYARQVAHYYGTDHYEIRCTPQDVIHDLPHIAWHADNLLADQAALALYEVSKLAKQHVTVCLSGDGGDETFIGYPTFHANRYHSLYASTPRWLRNSIIEPIVHMIPTSSSKLSFDYKAKKFVEAGDFSAAKAHYWWRTIFSDDEKKRLLHPNILSRIPNIDSFSQTYGRFFYQNTKLDFGTQALYADMKVWLAGNNLYKVDTMTMAHGLEGRVPFLDHELVEYMAKLPFHLKFRNHILKYLLKKILKTRLPEKILHRKKAGWHMPISGWIQSGLQPYLRQILLDDNPPGLATLLKPEPMLQLINDHVDRKINNAFKLWSLLILTHWKKEVLNS